VSDKPSAKSASITSTTAYCKALTAKRWSISVAQCLRFIYMLQDVLHIATRAIHLTRIKPLPWGSDGKETPVAHSSNCW